MRIAIHQPEHFPYLGFFKKMQYVDLFVILDDVQFTKGNFQNRNKFLNTNGIEEWFTVTVESGANRKLIKDVKVNTINNWKDVILRKLKQNLNLDMTDIYRYDDLLSINMASIQFCRNKLNISTPIVMTSELNIDSNSSQRLADICNKLQATEYVSGPGGKNYLDIDKFNCNVSYYSPDVPDYYSTLQHI